MIEIDLCKFEKKRVWVKDSSKKGGGYWSHRRVGIKENVESKYRILTENDIKQKLETAGIEPDPDDCISTAEWVAEVLGGKIVIGYYIDEEAYGMTYQPHVWNKVGDYTIDMTASQISDSDVDLVITKRSHPYTDEIIEIPLGEIGDYDIDEVVENRKEYLDD
jgi:ribosomal protein L12E/L44/L45/RPP1/RPP2